MGRRQSPLGSDNAAGSSESPLKTLHAARDAARKINSDVTVFIDEGEYLFEEPLRLDERDSGILFKSMAGKNVIVSGGKKVRGWQKVSDNIWKAPLNEPNIVREFYVDGKKLTGLQAKRE